MVYYSGTYAKLLTHPHPNLGWMLQPADRMRPAPGIRFAIDNGCFRRFDEPAWRKMIHRIAATGLAPDFSVAPDILAGGPRSAELSYRYRRELDAHGWRVYLVLQDGMSPDFIRSVYRDWDGLFVGGTTAFKIKVIREIADLDCQKHVGRVNSLKRLLYAEKHGVQSADGTGLARFNSPRHQKIENHIRTGFIPTSNQYELWRVA